MWKNRLDVTTHSAMGMKIWKHNIVNAVDGPEGHSATLFMFHGSGGSGEDFKQWLDIINRQELKFRHIKIVYPTAPIQLYTPNGNKPSNVWFNRIAVDENVAELNDSIDKISKEVSDLIDKEVSLGIPINRIMVGGFSMGGCLAVHVAYRFNRSLAGCIAMSSFLNKESTVYSSLKQSKPEALPELLQFHGTFDQIVPIKWADSTFTSLKALGVTGTFITLDSADHEIVESELISIKNWLLKNLPPAIDN